MLHIWKNSSASTASGKISREFILKNYYKMTVVEIAEELDVAEHKVTREVYRLRREGYLKERKSKKLTKKERDFIEENVGKLNTNQMAKELGRRYKVIDRYLDRLEVKGVDLSGTRRREWTEEEHNYIIANYHKKARKEIARDLGVSPEDISNRIKVLMRKGLLKKRKSPRFTEMEIKYIKENKDALSGSEIARKLGRSHTNVIKYIKEMEGR